MVDLAFLLLTFFKLTSAFHKNRVMELTMPDPKGEGAPVSESNVLHLVLGREDHIHWRIGEQTVTTDYSSTGVRQVLLEQISANPRLIVLIKPLGESRFSNVVDILDEMDIAQVPRFAIVSPDEDDVSKALSLMK